ncbi:MAG: SDR family NAD(P)-dependent oxidoreductase [Pseudomonadota bacterium]
MHEFDLGLKGKVALITGGAGAIAAATARLFLAHGAAVFLTDRDGETLAALREELAPAGGAGVFVADITDSRQVAQAIDRCASTHGGIDCLVNAAGIFPEQRFDRMDDEQWRRVHAVNLDGTFYACRAAVPHLREGGSIVNITSIAAHRGSVRHAHYASSKAGVLGLSRSLAQELAPRIRVNCVSPGPVDTPMIRELWDAASEKILAATPLRRICTPQEVATAVGFLASNWASFISAETLHVNGGHYIYG